jgi:2-C-methyl-D-erythritol 4-phosphate cytidylyltransferase
MGRVWGIVVAGGSATRFGEEKQFVSLAGRPVAEWAVAACRSVCDSVVLVVPADALSSDATKRLGADVSVAGGATRAASVRAGLEALGSDAEVVVVHDAARPLARPQLFKAVLSALEGADVAGAICAVPVTDTVKRVTAPSGDHGEASVAETLDRSDLVAVQTPQAFSVEVLRRAHLGEPDATDDAALVEALGLTVSVVPGDPDNLKLTTPADLARAEQLAVR